MTDCELNEKLAELCGIEVVASNASGRWLLVNPPGGCLTIWDPLEDWQQAHEYVIPALTRWPCLVDICFRIDDTVVTLHRPFGNEDEEDETDYAQHIRNVCSDNVELPRAICELALEAAKALEEST